MRKQSGRTSGVNTGQESAGNKVVHGGGDEVSGPVPMHHRLRLGQTDGATDPNGAGTPSRDNRQPNNEGKTW
jgi:hypothetical protein